MSKDYIIKSILDEIKYNSSNENNRIKLYCFDYFIKNSCLGNCSKAHSTDELQIKILEEFKFDRIFFMFHYRTEYCPLIDFEHQKNNCIYAHNGKEFRRSYCYNLKPKLCDKTKKNKNCKDNYYCKYLHNELEYLYHPVIYKKNKCKLLNDHNKNICHLYHNLSEKRKIKIIDIDYFILWPPKNFKNMKMISKKLYIFKNNKDIII